MQHAWDFFTKGGIIMYPLLLCSIIGITIVIEKLYTLRRKRIIIPAVTNVIEGIKTPDDIRTAAYVCNQNPGPFSSIVSITLDNHGDDKETLKEALSDQGRQEIHRLEKGLVVLETIAGIAPLLGLLGTVLGILQVFNIISAMGIGQAEALAGGISEALITTIAGLFIGIPAVVAYNYFTQKAETLVLEIERHSNNLVGRIIAMRRQQV
jgi:biopolymer transport protein ExbB